MVCSVRRKLVLFLTLFIFSFTFSVSFKGAVGASVCV